MPIKSFKPVTPGQRYKTVSTFEEITSTTPVKSLLKPITRTCGRNNLGRITMRRRGGGHKRRYRIIDFKRDKYDIPARVAAIEYDPNRTANIALLVYQDGEKRYIIAPAGLKVNDTVVSSDSPEIKVGNSLPIRNVPLGTMIHNVEIKPGRGAQIARVAGSYVQLVAREERYAQLRFPSGEVRMVLVNCRATLGQVGNAELENITLGKAGRTRWLGRRPKVRGVAMNPVDHPLGGGEGKSSGGRHPTTPWGKPTKGYKTRKKKPSDALIVKRRK